MQTKNTSQIKGKKGWLIVVLLTVFLMSSAFAIGLAANTQTAHALVGSAESPIAININTVNAGSETDGYTYADQTVTIIENGYFLISGNGTATINRIKINGGLDNVNITLDGVNIDVSSTNSACAFELTDGATVNLTLVGANTLKSGANMAGLQNPEGATLIIGGNGSLIAIGGSTSSANGGAGIGGSNGGSAGRTNINSGVITATGGYGSAGIGGGYDSYAAGGKGGTITINGGIITAVGGYGGAGIGGSRSTPLMSYGPNSTSGNGGTITINGGNVAANGGYGSAGIGGGLGRGGGSGGGGNLTITGGVVTATGDSDASGIGSGYNGSGGTFTLDGDAFVVASSVTSTQTLISGILFDGQIGAWYGDGDITINYDITVPNDKTLLIPPDVRLIIEKDVTLTFEGQILGYDEVDAQILCGGDYGTFNYSGIYSKPPEITSIDLSDTNPPKFSESWTYNNGVYTLYNRADVTITGTSANQRRIVVAANATVRITLNNVTISGLGDNQSSLLLNSGANATLILAGTNTLTAGNRYAGIQAPSGTTLTIGGDGSLMANGNSYGAGIGGGYNSDGGNITITGGTVTATSGSGGAGIGGGYNSDGGNITITGGTINANGSDGGAGIGGGYNGSGGNGGNISINGGTVTAMGGNYGAGIGGGNNGSGGNISINGGTVTAMGGNYGAGIGGGYNGSGGTFTLNGGAFVAASSISDRTHLISGILFDGSVVGTWYGGNITINYNATIPSDKALIIPTGKTLIIEKGFTLTFNGQIYGVASQIKHSGDYGTLIYTNGYKDPNSQEINLSDATPQTFGKDWTYNNGVYMLNNGADVTITGTSANQRRIAVAANATVRITLDNVTISGLGDYQSPLFLDPSANVTLILVGTNTLTAGYGFAGIIAPSGTMLTIGGDGILTSNGGRYGAGIGGSDGGSGGNISINGGTVTAMGGNYGAGIGGGDNGSGGNISINGGTVTAMGGNYGAGIGGGYNGSGGTFTLNGGAFVAASSISDRTHLISGILFDGSVVGTWYGGNITINYNATIPSDKVLIIPQDAILTIAKGFTLTFNGQIYGVASQIKHSGNSGNDYGTLIYTNDYKSIGTREINLSETNPVLLGIGWTYNNGVYTLLDGADVTITGTSANQRRIEVAANATVRITIDNVTISGLGDYQSPLLLNSGANVTLILAGTSTLTAGTYCAGIQAPSGTTLTIGGNGSLTANGGQYGAGIGGGSSGGVFTLDGDAIVMASSVNGTQNFIRGILFIGQTGTCYGNDITISQNITVSADKALIIPTGITLIIAKGFTLTFNGQIYGIASQIKHNGNSGSDYGTLIYTNGYRNPNSQEINLSDNNPTILGKGWTYNNGVYTLLDGADVTITGTSANQRRIEVAANATVRITIDNVTISGLGDYQSPLLLNSGANVTLILAGTSTLTAGTYCAGIQAPSGTTLTIGGNGSLTANGGDCGAGIGGGSRDDGGNITITGGTVNATGSGSMSGGGAAGIGGGLNGNGGNITITGGTVTATSGGFGAGIGGGQNGDGGNITITGGTVIATGNYGGAGIGGGFLGNGGIITITGGTVNATGGNYAEGGGAGIGGGSNRKSGDIYILGGSVTAKGGSGGSTYGGAGIGSGGYNTDLPQDAVGTILIKNLATVSATGGSGAANIGYGGCYVGNNYRGVTKYELISDIKLVFDAAAGGFYFDITVEGNAKHTVPFSAGKGYTWDFNSTTNTLSFNAYSAAFKLNIAGNITLHLTGDSYVDAFSYDGIIKFAGSGRLFVGGTEYHIHSFTDYVSNNDATCTTDGTKTATCDGCDETDTITDEGTKLPHTYVEVVDAQYLKSAATCSAKAVYYKSCSVCGHKHETDTFEYGETLPHTYVEVVDAQYLKSAATCIAKAVYYKSCSVCGHAHATDTFEYGELAAHNYVENAAAQYLKSAATCTAKAVYYKSCSVCGHAHATDTFEYGETLPHTYAEVVDTQYLKSAATCTAKAVYYKSCSVCGHKHDTDTFEYGETLPHSYVEVVDAQYLKSAATCTAKAVYYKSCSVCGHAHAMDTFEHGELAEHNYVENAAAQYLKSAATCTAKAVYYKSCSVCGHKHDTDTFEYGETLPHSYVEVVDAQYLKSAPTCTAKAVYYKSCSVCGHKHDTDTFEYGELTEHNYVENAAAQYLKSAATCTAKAVYYKSCSVCGHAHATDTFEHGELAEHNYVENAAAQYLKSAATCTAKAVYYKSCSVCGHKHDTDTFEYGEMLPHSYVGVVDAQYLKSAASCSAKAVYYKSCSVCGHAHATDTFEYGETLPHSYVEVVDAQYLKSAATCTAKAVYYKSCSVCGHKHDTDTFEYGELDSHTASGWITDTPATETTAGSKHKECTVCGHILETEEIPATGTGHIHDYDDIWHKNDNGHWHECDCGEQDGFIEHTASGWIVVTPATETTAGSKHKVCTVCGYELETEIIPATGTGHIHDFDDIWHKDANGHWHECDCGEQDGYNEHTASDWIVVTPATQTTDGLKHKVCSVCGYELETEIIPATGNSQDYSIISGGDGSWRSDTQNGYEIRINADIAKFAGVKVNGILLSADKYTAVSGSTIVTLKAEYLQTLAEGDYDIEVLFTDGSVSTTLTIANGGGTDNPPKDGLSGGAIAGIVIGSVLVVAIGGFAIFWFVIKKKSFAELIAIFKKNQKTE